MQKFKALLLLLAAALLVLLICGFYEPLEVTRYTIADPELPAGLEGYKILQISDLHSALFGEEQQDMIALIQAEEPDLILLTGDIMDKRDADLDRVEMMLKGLQGIAPVYSVAGNHEYTNYDLYMELQQLYRQYQVTELTDSGQKIWHNGALIYLYGIGAGTGTKIYNGESFSIPACEPGCYGILLFHFDPYFDQIAQHSSGYSLLFAGHSHGGLIRLPLIGPVIGNDGSLFPAYAGGVFEQAGLTMISSRGLGESILPRFNNPPELVSVTLTQG